MEKKILRAALYLRSSKDRSDVSIDAQRRELQKLAADRGFLIVQEYADVVESAKDEFRPGFQQLLRDLKASTRAWSVVLMVDTSRLSRNVYVAQVFKHEADKRDIKILYSKVPESSPIMDVMILSVMQAFDQVHSMMSREKGLAGMAENVRQGYRAGGRAPRGYRLKTLATGAIRDGAQVTKTVLESSDKAPLVARYLKGRAAGRSRKALCDELEISWPDTSLIGMEWNVLTYAGHTVWNVHNEFQRGEGYKGGQKRRPRSEWVIQRNTHEALISDGEAESILTQLENSNHGKSRRSHANYLLTGLLKTPVGNPWYGNGSCSLYRTRLPSGCNKTVQQAALEEAVLTKVAEDMKSKTFIDQLTLETKRFVQAHQDDPTAKLKQQVTEINGQISKAMDIALELANRGPVLRKIDELETQRNTLVTEINRLDQERQFSAVFGDITEKQVAQLLEGVIAQMQGMQREALKDMLGNLLDQVELDPDTLACRLHYRIGVESWDKVASPRRFELLSPP